MNKVKLIAWHFVYKKSPMESSLTYIPNFPVQWLLIFNTQIPIEFNVYGNYKMDEKNVEEVSATLSEALKKNTEFNNVKRYSSRELKNFGIG